MLEHLSGRVVFTVIRWRPPAKEDCPQRPSKEDCPQRPSEGDSRKETVPSETVVLTLKETVPSPPLFSVVRRSLSLALLCRQLGRKHVRKRRLSLTLPAGETRGA